MRFVKCVIKLYSSIHANSKLAATICKKTKVRHCCLANYNYSDSADSNSSLTFPYNELQCNSPIVCSPHYLFICYLNTCHLFPMIIVAVTLDVPQNAVPVKEEENPVESYVIMCNKAYIRAPIPTFHLTKVDSEQVQQTDN